MNAGFVREGVLPHQSLVWLGAEGDDRGQQLAARINFFGDDTSLEGIFVAPGFERHYDLFESRVARTLADAVDGAFDLTRARLHCRDRIRDREAKIVMAVHADNRRIAQYLHHSSDQSAVLVGY